ncbi:MAG: hypothetical protein BWK73_17270 [Thiothrix lacustris]|uniref:WxL domain-containing protein n=1 Tax=Thiothrix lacustris TaxID=525917 RepID=A0A1Y1QR68_9GAMM|nr:MAG: hypothetical protein BWK73_17270 [Thiothrix lacustris]
MKLKQKLLLALVASILATPAAFAYTHDTTPTENTAALAHDDVDYHNVSIAVPEIALIDVTPNTTGTAPAITFTAPTDAGAGFTNPVVTGASTLAYSSNVAAVTPGLRKITVAVSSATGAGAADLVAIPAGVTLGMTPTLDSPTAGTVGTCETAPLSSTVTSCDLITGIANYATGINGKTLTYVPTITGAGGMIAHTASGAAKTVRLVYTLSSAS